MDGGRVVAVAKDAGHHFSKAPANAIQVVAGLGVEGDAHQGATLKRRSRRGADAMQPNLCQVHLIHTELFDELRGKGFAVGPGDLGENITTEGLDLLALPRWSLLRIGMEAELEVTGLRHPCIQIERFQPGLLAAVLERGPKGRLIRKAGIMSVVKAHGLIRPGDMIPVELPVPPHQPLKPVCGPHDPYGRLPLARVKRTADRNLGNPTPADR